MNLVVSSKRISKLLAFEQACEDGDLSTAMYLHSIFPDVEIKPEIYYRSSKKGRLDMLQWLLQCNPNFFVNIIGGLFVHACMKGHLHVVQWIHNEHPDLVTWFHYDYECWFDECYESGHHDHADCTFEPEVNDVPHYLVRSAFVKACAYNKMHVAKWLVSISSDLVGDDGIEQVLYHGSLDFLKWILTVCKSIPHDMFSKACCGGNLSTVQWLLNTYSNIGVHYSDNTAYELAYTSGHAHILEYLITTFPRIKHEVNQEQAFHYACTFGNMMHAQWLLDVYPEIDNESKDETFAETCMFGSLTTAKWLLTKYPTINYDLQYMLPRASEHGHLDIVQWLISINTNVDIHMKNNATFMNACHHNHLPIIKWLLATYPSIDVHMYQEYAFVMACANANIEMAEWLLDTYPDIDIRVNNDAPLRQAVAMNRVEILSWLKNRFDINLVNDTILAIANGKAKMMHVLTKLTKHDDAFYYAEYMTLFAITRDIFEGAYLNQIYYDHNIYSANAEDTTRIIDCITRRQRKYRTKSAAL